MYRVRQGLRLRKGPSETFWAFDLESGEHYEVNTTAFKVLEALEGGAELETIVLGLADEYGTDEDIVRADVAELLETCATEGLVTREA
jgi:hypothetical protein